MTINIGLVGLGDVGKKHLFNTMQLRDAKLVAVADSSKKSRALARELGVRYVYDDYVKLLDNSAIDCVIISLPNFLHAECAKMAAECGKHVLIEKPLARSVEEAKEIASAVRKKNLKGMVGYPMRFIPQFVDLRRKLSSGVLGDVVTVYATNVSSGPVAHRVEASVPMPVPSWWFDPKLTGGGALLDLGSHLINLLRWYFGDQVEFVKSVFGRRFNMDMEDSAMCLLKFKGGPTAAVNVGWFFFYGHAASIEFFGTASRAVASASESMEVLKRGLAMFRRRLYRETSPYYFYELEYFVRCIRDDLAPKPSLEDGVKDLEIISLAYKNAVVL